jgi:plasmid segregation protein ParM
MQAPTIMDTLPVAPVPTMAEKSEPEPSIETAPEIVGSVEVEASQAQPAKEPSSEVVAPSAVETFEPQLVAEMPQETVIPSIVGELEAQTVTEMPAEAIASSATQRPKARTVKSPAQKPKAQSVAELPAKSSKAVMPDRVVLAQSITPRSGRSHMILSIDIGYGYTKGVGPEGLRFSFPSVIGTAEEIPFSIGLTRGNEDQLVQYGDSTFSYGEQALLQSRIQTTIFDRSRIRDHVYKMLFVATLVEMSRLGADCKHVKVITGLPVDFFNDRAEVIKAFEGAYQITAGRAIKCTVDSVYVAPQPFGSLFRELLNDHGKIIDSDIEKRRIGVIDVGTYTTDFVVSDALRYVQRLSGTIRIGWSKVITKVQQALSDTYRLELVPHEVDRALQAGVARVHGKEVSLESFISPAVAEVQTAVVARARDLWGDAADLDSVLVTGGAGAPMYDAIQEVYPHARLLDNAFWANVEGLQRFARRPATFNE